MTNEAAETMVEVTVAPGHSLTEPVPGGLQIARIKVGRHASGGDIYEERVVDSPVRTILPGEKTMRPASAVPHLIKGGFILDPATGRQQIVVGT